MIIPVHSDDVEAHELYMSLLALFDDIKLIQGPQGVYSTLRRHKDVNQFMLQYQIDKLKTLENEVIDLYK